MEMWSDVSEAEGGERSREPSHFAESVRLTPCRMWSTCTT